MSSVLRDIQERLSLPFAPDDHGFKPAMVRGDAAKALIYIDARNVMDRLDEVVGMTNWRDHYEMTPDGVKCCLEVRIDGEWIAHEDFGAFSEQPDAGDRFKSAFSDSLKRAAVKFGIGRYLYAIDLGWIPYDGQKKRFADEDKLHTVTKNRIRDLLAAKEKAKPKSNDPLSKESLDKIRGLLAVVASVSEQNIVEAYAKKLNLPIKTIAEVPEHCANAIIERLTEVSKKENTEKKGESK